jgi:uncharacterized protein YndB with AHSA1/START domain
VIRNEVSALLAAPPERVFAFLVDEDKLKRWIGGMLESRQVSGAGPGIGAAYRQVLVIDGQQESIERVITDHDPGALLGFRIHAGSMEIAGRFELESEGTGTRLQYVQETESRSLGMALLKSMVSARIQRKIQADLATLKRLVERPD